MGTQDSFDRDFIRCCTVTVLSIEESGWVPKVYPPDSFDRDFIRCCTVTVLSIEESGWVPKA